VERKEVSLKEVGAVEYRSPLEGGFCWRGKQSARRWMDNGGEDRS
jgi:hypothetical protein